MKNIGIAILAVCLGMLGSFMLQAQNTLYGDFSFDGSSGDLNAVFGYEAFAASNGNHNSVFGQQVDSSSIGDNNSAFGYWALVNNQGHDNSAFGYQSMDNSANLFLVGAGGADNSAFGSGSLGSDVSGSNNSAVGFESLFSNKAGDQNTASGSLSLFSNNTGNENTASGSKALYSNTSGDRNTAVGHWALFNNETGSYNIGIGQAAGNNLPSNSSQNIDIGSEGSASDYNPTIRIGIPGIQEAFYAAGVNGKDTDSQGVLVYIDNNGKLGTVKSSIRFKEDVHDMAAASDGLMRLRPVTYRYKKPYADGSKPIDYGLIAEEVAEVYPDLVVKDAEGQIQTVQYQKLTPMLLNEVQKQHKLMEQQEATVQQQAETIQRLEKQLSALPLLEKRLAALEAAQPSSTMLESRLETK